MPLNDLKIVEFTSIAIILIALLANLIFSIHWTLSYLLLGFLVGEIVDFIYDKLNDTNIEGRHNLLHWFEHYHWGMTLLFLYEFPSTYFPNGTNVLANIFASPIILGFGVSLILDETRSETRFAWNKRDIHHNHFYESSVIGVMIGLMLTLRWLLIPISTISIILLLDVIFGSLILLKKPYKLEITNYRKPGR